MAEVTKIGTNGYRGPDTEFVYLPLGEYEVGPVSDFAGGVVSRGLAARMLKIDLAWIVETAPEPEPASEPKPRKRARKVVEGPDNES